MAGKNKQGGGSVIGYIFSIVLVGLAIWGFHVYTGVDSLDSLYAWAKGKSDTIDNCTADHVEEDLKHAWKCDTSALAEGGSDSNAGSDPSNGSSGSGGDSSNGSSGSGDAGGQSGSLFSRSPKTLSGVGSSDPTTVPEDIVSFDTAVAVQALQAGGSTGLEGYSDSDFERWLGERCDTREAMLRDMGQGVNVDDLCHATSGTWTDSYTGETIESQSKVAVDSVIPLHYAYEHGASAWDSEKKAQFANDKSVLALVSEQTAQAKGDSGFSAYAPQDASRKCAYASDWVRVAQKYGLTVSADDKKAIEDTVSTCSQSLV